MATWTNINAGTLTPAGAPSTNLISAATDQFAAEFGSRYLLRFTNASATPSDVRVTDPTSVAPQGNTLPGYATAITALPATTGVRTIEVDANRFRNASGFIVFTYPAAMNNAGSLVEIYGPL